MTKNTKTNPIPEELIPTIEKILVEFSYAKISKKRITNLINKNEKIIELLSTNPIKIQEISTLLKKDVLEYAITYLEKTKYEYITEYIKQNCDFSNQKTFVNELKKVSALLRKMKIDQSIDTLYNIYNNVNSIKECMQLIVKFYEEDLKNNMLFSILNDEIINLFVEFYCDETNIVIEDEQETKQNTNPTDIYCVNLADEIIKKAYQFRKLTKPETNELILKSQQGNNYATEKLINHHQRLVIRIAGRFQDDKNDFVDLYQDGCIGLLDAIEKFDVAKGFAFSTYATWWIKQKINRGKRERYGNISYPSYIHERLQYIKKEIAVLYNTLGYEPSMNAIIKHLTDTTKLTETDIIDALNLQYGTTSYNEVIDFENTTELIELIEDENIEEFADIISQENVSKRFQEIIEKIGLTQRELEIFKHRTGIFETSKKTLEYIGDRFGVSRERIRQVESSVIRKIFESEYARDFCDLCEDSELAWNKVVKYRKLKKQNQLPNKKFSAEKLNEFLTNNNEIEEETLCGLVEKTKEELDDIICEFPKRIQASIKYYYDESYRPKEVSNNKSYCTKKYLINMTKKLINKIDNGLKPEYDYKRKRAKSKGFNELFLLDEKTFKTQIWSLFTNTEKEFVLKFYTENFERNSIKMSSKDNFKIYNEIVLKYLPEETKKKLLISQNMYAWFYENNTNFQKLIWPLMFQSERELISKYYDKDFKRTNLEFQEKDQKNIYDILKKYYEYLENDYNSILNIKKHSLCSLTQLSKENLDIIIDRVLTPEIIHLISKYYNKQYERNDEPFEGEDLPIIYHLVIRKINHKKNLTNMLKTSKNITDCLNDYFGMNYEDFLSLIWPIVTPTDKQTFRTFYTKNFARNKTPYADDSVKTIIDQLIKKYIFLYKKDLEIIRTLRYQNLSDILVYPVELIKQFINEENQEIICKYFDQNLCKRKARVVESDFIYLYYAISDIKTKLDLAYKIGDYNIPLNINNNEANILLLKITFNYSNQDIANTLNIRCELVDETINKYLEITEQTTIKLARKKDNN